MIQDQFTGVFEMKLVAFALTLAGVVFAEPHHHFNPCNPKAIAADAQTIVMEANNLQRAITGKVNFLNLRDEIAHLSQDANRLAREAGFAHSCRGLGREYQQLARSYRELEMDFNAVLNSVIGPRPGLVRIMDSISAAFSRISRQIF